MVLVSTSMCAPSSRSIPLPSKESVHKLLQREASTKHLREEIMAGVGGRCRPEPITCEV